MGCNMDELIAAILLLYNSTGGTALKAATPGGMWLTQAPTVAQGTVIVLVPIASPEEPVMNSMAATLEPTIQFSVFNQAPSTDDLVIAAGKLIRPCYHNVILTMPTLRMLSAQYGGERPFMDPVSFGFQFNCEMKFMLGR